eukprot:252625-Karenia_brevis.AAC.1
MKQNKSARFKQAPKQLLKPFIALDRIALPRHAGMCDQKPYNCQNQVNRPQVKACMATLIDFDEVRPICKGLGEYVQILIMR